MYGPLSRINPSSMSPPKSLPTHSSSSLGSNRCTRTSPPFQLHQNCSPGSRFLNTFNLLRTTHTHPNASEISSRPLRQTLPSSLRGTFQRRAFGMNGFHRTSGTIRRLCGGSSGMGLREDEIGGRTSRRERSGRGGERQSRGALRMVGRRTRTGRGVSSASVVSRNELITL